MRVAFETPEDRPLTIRGLEALTDGELEQLSRLNPTLRLERSAEGEILFMPPTHTDSGRRNARIAGSLFQWFDKHLEQG